MIHVQSLEGIGRMQECGRINALVHERVRQNLMIGISTRELDDIAHRAIREFGAQSSIRHPLSFPGDISISVNEEIGHGVPGPYELRAGDLVKVDISIEFRGVHTDSAVTHVMGSADPSSIRLVQTTRDALFSGISRAVPGGRCSDISAAIDDAVRQGGVRIVRHASGHGIGAELHEEPTIVNFGPPNLGPRLREGMVLAIEPVTSAGSRFAKQRPNGWTDVTVDGSASAHFEHTVAVTKDGPQVLTTLPGVSNQGMTEEATFVEGPQRDDGLSFRGMRPEEEGQLLRMAAREMDPILMEAWGRRVNPAEIFHDDGWTLVAEGENGEILGFVVVMEQNNALHVNTLVVDQKSQGRGIGSAAMLRCEAIARSRGLGSMTLCVQTNNERAIRFYHRLGYQDSRPVHPNSILMRKNLALDE